MGASVLRWRKEAWINPSVPILHLMDAAGGTVYQDRIDWFPFSETVIRQACNEFFHDPNPCEIHRSAARLRLCAEIEEALPAGQSCLMEELSSTIASYFQGHDFACLRIEKITNTEQDK